MSVSRASSRADTRVLLPQPKRAASNRSRGNMAASRFIAAKIRISAQFHHERRCFFIPKKAKRTKNTKKHFVFGNFDFFGYFRNRKFLYPEKGEKGEKDENVVFSCLQKLRTFCYKRQRRQLGTTCLSRIGEFEKLGTQLSHVLFPHAEISEIRRKKMRN